MLTNTNLLSCIKDPSSNTCSCFVLLNEKFAPAISPQLVVVFKRISPLQDKDKVLDVGSLLTFDLSFNLPPPPCVDLCPVLNDYQPNTYRAVVSPLFTYINKSADLDQGLVVRSAGNAIWWINPP